ncbi:unnamed protein product [Rotaria sordida]|uniref:Uncharacterized protein n=1 Tax=Rotaria sordida TaxID=392033 RepID=A0A819MYE5_9BILA|nr:unnamed protein product [Rotaria sordida]
MASLLMMRKMSVPKLIIIKRADKLLGSRNQSSLLNASHKCSSTTAMVRQFSHIPTSDTSLFAAHHEKFSFSLFAPLPSNPTNPGEIPSSNLLASSLISNPPLKRF